MNEQKSVQLLDFNFEFWDELSINFFCRKNLKLPVVTKPDRLIFIIYTFPEKSEVKVLISIADTNPDPGSITDQTEL